MSDGDKDIDKNKKNSRRNEIIVIFNDVIRMLAVYGLAHLFECVTDTNKILLNKDFVHMMIFFIIATILYHVFIKKVMFIKEE